ncbi:MAG: hypothetical protein HGB35_05595, partial [Geobacteraceae bacterium]|nr:hypothetical protein [Geobacteraceae bacterium]
LHEVVTMSDGQPLPWWLEYEPDTKRFVATNVPSGAVPAKVLLTIDGQRYLIDVSCR